ncbi:glycosyltransferase [Algoriphagus hitonicola]|uniref:Glycosyltransferase involved in cell wall bisynthesis n=1 Tax=Algoriphagus hitonicola TaxID=435880 RepID=A0A1I2X3U5_9BACT|nr:glycosyltransferase [Algoriphagus hitonicola]SFH08190.1 Glycosyltransferase involved in cell wall bisynthesis [Algoriphagus hitonicola]
MKVLQIIDSLDFGGMEKLAVNFANALSSKDISNILVSTRKSGPLLALLNNKTDYYELDKKSTLDILSFWKLLKIVKNSKPAVIHAHATSVFWAIMIKKIIPDIKLVYHEHYGGIIADSSASSRLKILQRFKSSLFGCVVVNEELKQYFEGVFEKRVKVVYLENFVAETNYEKNICPVNRFLCVANFKKPKNHFDLIKGLAIVRQKGVDANLTMIGRVDDQAYFEQLKALILELDLMDFIVIEAPRIDLLPYYINTDVGILISDAEGLPMSVLEFGIHKIPVIVSSVGQCVQLLEGGENGSLVKVNDPKDISEKMLDVCMNPDAREKRVKNFYKKVISKHSEKSFLSAYFKFLN